MVPSDPLNSPLPDRHARDNSGTSPKEMILLLLHLSIRRTLIWTSPQRYHDSLQQ